MTTPDNTEHFFQIPDRARPNEVLSVQLPKALTPQTLSSRTEDELRLYLASLCSDMAVLDRLRTRRYATELNSQLFSLDDLKLCATLGVGAFGVVGCVEHGPTGVKYALKMINREQVTTKKQQATVTSNF